MKAVFLIGSRGQVAKALTHSLRGRDLTISSRNDSTQLFLDLETPESIRQAFKAWHQKGHGPGEVYLPGALTAVDFCEQNPDKSERINVLGPKTVAEECRRYGDKLLFYSTEYVFGEAEYHGGPKGPFREEDPPAPTSVYGKHKLAAEQVIQEILPDALIVRTTMVFSYDPEGTNFAMQVYRTLTNPIPPAARIRIPTDQISTPTYAADLADGSIYLVKKGLAGIFHIVGKDLLSRPEFIRRLARCYHVEEAEVDRRFEFVPTSQLSQPAKRPLTAGLLTAKAERSGVRIRSLEEALSDLERNFS